MFNFTGFITGKTKHVSKWTFKNYIKIIFIYTFPKRTKMNVKNASYLKVKVKTSNNNTHAHFTSQCKTTTFTVLAVI